MKTEGKATTAIIHETGRKTAKEGFHPVKLRVTYRRQRKYYTLQDPQRKSLHLPKDAFAEVMNLNTGERKKTIKAAELTKDKKKELRLHLAGIETKAQEIINGLHAFSFDTFERQFFSKSDAGDVFARMENKAKELRREGRISTAVTFECTLISLKLFHIKKSLRLDQVNVSFLRKYEAWMLQKGNGYTTIGIYVRNLRAVFNDAKQSGELKDVPYPFGKKGYQIPTGRNVKKALKQADIAKVTGYPCIHGSTDEMYRDLWMFSYLCNGINIKDLSLLKYRNIDGDIIRLIRAKTERENRKNPRTIEIVITRQVGRIIDRWANKPAAPDSYLFPILAPEMPPEQQYKRIQDYTARINNTMKRISEDLGLPMKVTTYTARHSFATVLKRSGASTEFISESLGHSNLQTTENYLDQFEIDVKREWAEKLTTDKDH